MAQNMEVAALQAHLQQTGAKWRAGTTTLSALSPAQRRLRLGAVPPPRQPTMQEREQAAKAKHAAASASTAGAASPSTAGAAPGPAAGAAVAAPPASVDLRDVNGSNYITPIKDQASCGCCIAFGTTAAVEGTLQVQSGNPNLGVDLSEAQLFYCIAEAQQGRTCAEGLSNSGWDPYAALDAYQNSGIADEACFPYKAGDQPCNQCADYQFRLTKITGYHTLSATADMKTWLSTRGPLVTWFTVYDDFMYYTGGIYSPTSSVVDGGHCVCVVGYDDANGCWICKNSWGTGWGEGGFFRIAYAQCGIDTDMLAVDGVTVILAIGGYDLLSPADRAFAFDYDGTVKLDHLVLYRPGSGVIYILKNSGGNFSTVPPSGGNGIGGYDLKSTADQAFAYDYDGSGKLDHLVLYRPGTGAIFILKNSAGQFSPVYAQGAPGNGIGGYDLKSTADQAFAFDYDGSGKLDHFVLYRPGARVIYILKNSSGQFAAVYPQ